MNRVALFTATPRSATSLLIAGVTDCPIVHAAIEVNGRWYHASESLGKFGEVDVAKYAKRHCIIYEFNGDLSDWLISVLGKEYDWRGIFGWGLYSLGVNRLNKGNPKHFYCFKAIFNALKFLAAKESSGQCYYAVKLNQLIHKDKPISGCDISQLFEFGKYMRFGDL